MSTADDLKKIARDLESTQKKASDGKDAEEFDSYDDFIDYLEDLGVNKITAMMNDYPAPQNWFPSGWRNLDWTEGYPKILAKALVKAKDKESITDLANIYYSRNRLSPEAIQVFKKDVLADTAKTIEFLTSNYLPQGLDGFAKQDLAFVKSMLMLLNDVEMKAHVKAVQENTKSRAAEKYFSSVGIDPADYA